MDDLLEFGKVQRGLLGIEIADVNALIAESFNLPVNQGVLVNGVREESAALASGIKEGDVIIGINGHIINSVSELQEWVARNRPGEQIKVKYIRNGKQFEVNATLRNSEGREALEKRDINYSIHGAEVEDVPYRELARLMLEGGVRIKSIDDGKWKNAGVKEKFIVTHIDKVPVDNVDDLNRILEYKKGGMLVEGIYENGQKGTYGIEW